MAVARPTRTKPKSKAKGRAKGTTTRRRTTKRTPQAPPDAPALALHHLKPPAGSRRPALRVGRGPGSGLGKTAGRGHKGQGSRAGGNVRPGFEGGQMPLVRRIPKRGFTNPFRTPAQVVNVRHLGLLAEDAEVTPDTLFGAGLVRRPDAPIKLLGMGEVARRFVVRGVSVSASARGKIEQAGGTIEG